MYYVLILLAIVAIIVIGTWLGGLVKSKKVDVDQDAEQAAETMAAWRRRQEDDQIHQAGTQLRCLNCNHVFTGPMPDTGCPNCHVASLVVPADRMPAAPPAAGPAPQQATIGVAQNIEAENADQQSSGT